MCLHSPAPTGTRFDVHLTHARAHTHTCKSRARLRVTPVGARSTMKEEEAELSVPQGKEHWPAAPAAEGAGPPRSLGASPMLPAGGCSVSPPLSAHLALTLPSPA